MLQQFNCHRTKLLSEQRLSCNNASIYEHQIHSLRTLKNSETDSLNDGMTRQLMDTYLFVVAEI